MKGRLSGPVEPELLRTLSISECALTLLRDLVQENAIHSNNMFVNAKRAYQDEADVDALLERLSDAWGWLESRGFLGPHPTQSVGWQRVTERGGVVAASNDALAQIVAEDRLVMSLHKRLEVKVRPIFGLGDHETAAFAAFKEVEVRVREIASAHNSDIGVDLMHSAFRKDGGSLVDPGANSGEQVATMNLFAGAIGSFKNPASHRTVDYADPTEAAEVILLADLLMRILDRVEHRQAADKQ